MTARPSLKFFSPERGNGGFTATPWRARYAKSPPAPRYQLQMMRKRGTPQQGWRLTASYSCGDSSVATATGAAETAMTGDVVVELDT